MQSFLILPWDQRTPLGYFREVACVQWFGLSYMILNGALLCLFVSICMHHRAFYLVFRERKWANRDKLVALIRFHIAIKNWFYDSAEIYSSMILVYLVCSMLFMACTIFQLDLQLQHIDFSFLLLSFAFAISASNIFVYCYFGKMATESYRDMANCLFEANWHEYPVEIQKYFILFIANAQKPVYYHGSKIVTLDLEMFTRLIRSVFTFYMMFKTFTSN